MKYRRAGIESLRLLDRENFLMFVLAHIEQDINDINNFKNSIVRFINVGL